MRKILFFILTVATMIAHAGSNFTFSNVPGQYAVGLQIVQMRDYSRAYKGATDLVTGEPTNGDRARPVQALIWYPAQNAGKPVTYAEYVKSAGTEENFDQTDPAVISRTAALLAGVGLEATSQQIHEEAIRPMWAVRDAAPISGKFPVVIYAPSFSASAYENADLCEFLASQGYIVLASPDMGAHTRGMTDNLEGIDAQVGDIEFLIAHAHTMPHADMAHIAVVGYSWGGISNVFTAAKDSRISALVSLDGSVRYYPGLVKEAHFVTPARVAIPFLFIAAKPFSLEDLVKRKDDLSDNFLNQMVYSDVYKLTMYPMVHANFSSQFIRYGIDSKYDEYSREEVSLAHSWMARYVSQFLNAYLKNDATALAFLDNKPAANGAPVHMMTMDKHQSQGVAPTMESFAGELAQRGFEHAMETYQEFRKRDPGFQLSEGALNSWGYDLLRIEKKQQAIGIFKLGTTLYPESGNLFDSQADAYEHAGDKPNAIKSYQRSLELDPKNGHAINRLKALGA